jgi:hypothetical protein
MKLRLPVIFAVMLAVIAIGAWMWFGRDGAVSTGPDDSGDSAAAKSGRALPAGGVLAPDTPSVQGAGRTVPPTQAAEPVRMTSSVVPGLPMVRTSTAPPGIPADAMPLSVPGAVLRPERQVEGREELLKVQSMLRDYRTRMGGNPVGTNAEIMKAVMGGNSAGARLGPPDGQEINEQGELVDQWKTPYFFHQLSKDSMEVRSAGPDRQMWTADDLITK